MRENAVRAKEKLNGEEPLEQNKALANQVIDAFNELVEKDAAVIARYEKAFKERAQDPTLSESKGEVEGMTLVLSGLLRRIPFEKDLRPHARSAQAPYSNESFKRNFRIAAGNLADRYPRVLQLLKRHLEEIEAPMPNLLRALFVLYDREKTVYPY